MNLSVSRTIHHLVAMLLLSLWTVISPARTASAEVPLSPREGFIQVDGGPVWYRIYGTGTGTPLLMVHGGPGSRSCVFEPLAELLGKERPIILYDQLGSGRSGRPGNTNLWTLKRFVTELGQVRTALGVRDVHLLGYSWGAGLVVSYLGSAGLPGVESATLIGPYLSTKTWIEDADLLLAQLPEEVQQTLKHHEQDGTTQSQEYLAASEVFYSRFYYHKPKPPLPDSCEESPRNSHIYRQMWGPSEFRSTGSLVDFDVTPLLPRLNLPVLIVVGRFDEARPETATGFVRKLANAQVRIVEDCGHMLPLEAPAIVADTINHFLRQNHQKQEWRK